MASQPEMASVDPPGGISSSSRLVNSSVEKPLQDSAQLDAAVPQPQMPSATALPAAGGVVDESRPESSLALPPSEAESHEKPQTASTNEAMIELLLVSGSRKTFSFSTSLTISEVLAFVYKEWPEGVLQAVAGATSPDITLAGWSEQRPDKFEQLRL